MTTVVVGGGMYGCAIAAQFARDGERVVLLERRGQLLSGASYANQARVHGGYHYPRALVTAGRSRANYGRFLAEFRDCVDATYLSVYAIAAGSLTSAATFRRACAAIGAPLRAVPPAVRALLDPRLIPAAWATEEAVFDASKLAVRMGDALTEAGVDVRLGRGVRSVSEAPGGVVVELDDDDPVQADRAIVCAYGALDPGLPPEVRFGELHCEPCEMALVETPPTLKGIGLTVMDGPFFSLMPFPARGLHTLSHVRYTPHGSYPTFVAAQAAIDAGLPTRFDRMARDAARYLRGIEAARRVDSLWSVKVVPRARDANDARPILIRRTSDGRVTNVLGSKIDNVFDALVALPSAVLPAGSGSAAR